ncbi:molybdopterin-dependent oxidoreductase [Calidithermus timidus]|uniref:molybdopterin-dependent oxidoreductase n=1 Tax=Calidithermus timidus TaxID=307124 RepID=UPI0003A98BA7|nr:molybdopterin-dependent oxidoreductase [Calidithermus timidus]
MNNPMHRRTFLQRAAGVLAAAGALPWVKAQTSSQASEALPSFTGPQANPYWNGVNPFVVYPQKLPLLRLTDRGIQLETPRQYFRTAFTPNEAFFVRYHLDLIPNSIDLSSWRLNIEGNVEKPLSFSMQDLLTRFKPVSVAAVNQCSGNSRSRFQPRVAGGQWGNGAMGNALWTGVRLMDLLQEAGVKPGTVQLQFQGLERGPGPEGKGSNAFIKSLDWNDPVLQECLVAYQMNGEPLPMLNGFPVRLVVPGKFSTYWMKHLTWIRALTQPDDNFWMATAYRIPDTPRGNTTPADVAAGKVKTVPIGHVNMPVRSFIVDPDGSSKLVAGLPVEIRGVAFSGYGRVTRVEVSLDGGKSWRVAQLGEYYGPYAFRTWSFQWKPTQPGRYTLAVRATDEKGNTQPDEPVWNPGGYLWNRIERQDVVVGRAS